MAEKDYVAIAKRKIQRPAEVNRAPNFHIYARNKKGKTTFGMSAGVEKTLIIDPEHGTDAMKAKNPHVWPIEVWSDIDDAYNYLRSGKHPYEWVVVDGLTRLSNMSLKHVMRVQEERDLTRTPGFVQKQDYGKAGELMKTMLTSFYNLPQGVIYTSQERMQEGFDSEEDEDLESGGAEFVPDLPKGVRGYVNSLVEVIGRLYVVKVDDPKNEGETKPQRRLWVGQSVKYDTGYRADFVLPDMIRMPTIPKLVSLMETGAVPKKRS